jgi:hypothetical protein
VCGEVGDTEFCPSDLLPGQCGLYYNGVNARCQLKLLEKLLENHQIFPQMAEKNPKSLPDMAQEPVN